MGFNSFQKINFSIKKYHLNTLGSKFDLDVSTFSRFEPVTKQMRIKCLAEGHNTASSVKLDLDRECCTLSTDIQCYQNIYCKCSKISNTSCLQKGLNKQPRAPDPKEAFWSGSSLFAILTNILWIPKYKWLWPGNVTITPQTNPWQHGEEAKNNNSHITSRRQWKYLATSCDSLPSEMILHNQKGHKVLYTKQAPNTPPPPSLNNGSNND